MKRPYAWLRDVPPVFAILVLGGLAIFARESPENHANGPVRLRLAYMPNVTHAPALIGLARGEFEHALHGKVAATAFNAGPEEMEALLSGAIDAAYVGPGPAINTYIKTHGKVLRIVAGACEGGAGLIGRTGVKIDSVADLDGKRVAVPQLGGTQDIALRHFMVEQGLSPVERGGSVHIIPVNNPDLLALFKRGQLDAAWVPEPWLSRLVDSGSARLVLDERDLWPSHRFTTTVIVARTDFLQNHPDAVRALLTAHAASVSWLKTHEAEGQKLANAELKKATGKALPEKVLKSAWSRVNFTVEPDNDAIMAVARAAQDAGYLKGSAQAVAGIIDAGPLHFQHVRVASSLR